MRGTTGDSAKRWQKTRMEKEQLLEEDEAKRSVYLKKKEVC
jgi:hypothetical protein